MRTRTTRLPAILVGLGLALALLSGPIVAAAPGATGTVEGKFAVKGGKMPSGCVVRASRTQGQLVSATTPVEADGSFKIADLLPGAYKFELVDPAGKVLWEMESTIQAGQNTLTSAISAPAGSSSERKSRKRAIWILSGAGAAMVGYGLHQEANDCDKDVSPSKPGCQKP